MNNFVLRTIVGLIFSLAVIGSAFAGPIAFSLLFGFFTIKGVQEFLRMTAPELRRNLRRVAMALAGIFYVLYVMNAEFGYSALWLFIPAIIWLLILCIEMIRVNEHFISQMSALLFGFVYVVVPFALLITLANFLGQFEPKLPFGFFLILWANDSGAYLTGKFFGKHKLLEAVSPKKTWEGLIGGMLVAVISGYFLCDLLTHTLPRAHWVAVAAIVAVFANLGDLIESQMKRIAGIKDSGKLLPGHGGVLDRFDGLLVALPLVIIYLITFVR